VAWWVCLGSAVGEGRCNAAGLSSECELRASVARWLRLGNSYGGLPGGTEQAGGGFVSRE